MSDQIKEIAYQAGRKIKAAFSEFGENVRSFAEAVSGRIRTWTDVRQSRLRKTSVQRVNAAEQQETANISQIMTAQEKDVRPIRRRNAARLPPAVYTPVSKINTAQIGKKTRLLRQVLLFDHHLSDHLLFPCIIHPRPGRMVQDHRHQGHQGDRGSQTSISPRHRHTDDYANNIASPA